MTETITPVDYNKQLVACPCGQANPRDLSYCPRCYRPRCAVISRIVGYLTDVRDWNLGKKSEWRQRKPFNISGIENNITSQQE